MRDALDRLVRYWETLSPETVARIAEVYAPDASFRDPFNDVRGEAALRRIFLHMYEQLDEPRFTIVETILEGRGAVLLWDFDFRMKGWKPAVPRRIHGASHVRFGDDGRVTEHRDYWDAAGELYVHLPMVGPLMRFLARRLAG